MCGIAGVARRDGSPLGDPAALAHRLSDALAHRGPDGRGTWRAPADDVLLVHRRLAIIDPTPDGAQPMASPDGRQHIIFNGEVYNFRELRRDLESRGERFRTSSDTEVLLRVVALDGPAGLSRVRGMFAFACWNEDTRSLLLARDRFGIKPLYLAVAPGSVAFSSELHALRASKLIDAAPSPAAVLAFLTWGSVPPPLAWNRGVEMLEAGTWFEWRQDGRESRGRYADARLPFVRRPPGVRAPSEADVRVAAGEAVRDAVRAHLVADVPVGVFLSGGIDSSAIVSAAATLGHRDLQTFTVTFEDPTNEAAAARAVAETFGTTHHELRLDAQHVARDFPTILSRLDQPTIDAVNSYYVSRAVAQTGIKAVLSGSGGDELFGGYPSFRRIPAALGAKRAAGPLIRATAPLVSSLLPPRLKTRWAHYAATNGDAREAYRTQRGFFMPAEIESMAGPALRDPGVWREAQETLRAVETQVLAPLGAEDPHAGVARMETRMYLASQLLRDLDVMSMAHSLEVRVPFVDHVLTSAIWPDIATYPSLLHGKRLLHETLQHRLPAAIASRPKQGFTLPFGIWMQDPLAPLVRDGLECLVRSGFVRDGAPDTVCAQWRNGATSWSRPWGLAVLGQFIGGRPS